MADLLQELVVDRCGVGFTITRQSGLISRPCGTPRLLLLRISRAILTNMAGERSSRRAFPLHMIER